MISISSELPNHDSGRLATSVSSPNHSLSAPPVLGRSPHVQTLPVDNRAAELIDGVMATRSVTNHLPRIYFLAFAKLEPSEPTLHKALTNAPWSFVSTPCPPFPQSLSPSSLSPSS